MVIPEWYPGPLKEVKKSYGSLSDGDKDKKMGEGANVEVVREVLSTVKPVGIPEWHVRGD